MGSKHRVGVYFCHAGVERVAGPDLPEVKSYAESLTCVGLVGDLGARPKVTAEELAHEIQNQGLDAVVVAGDAPGYFKPLLTRAMALAGRDTEEVRLASFGEHGAGLAGPTAAAKAVVACAVHRVPFGLAAAPDRTPVHPDTMVIGGGVAGIEAALRIADAGYKVYLVERSATLGGHMAMFDKTFPTLDCAACILTPKMVAVGQHPNIEILTCSEVKAVSGAPGDYRVKLLKRARRVDEETCIACHACADVCPVRVPSAFDHGIAERKAIYMPFPQAIPNAYVVDADNCIWLKSEGRKCGACVRKCPKDSIDLTQPQRMVELDVGNIVVATGYDLFDASRIDRYGYGRLPNVLTSLEFERLTNASGPTGGKVVLRTKKWDKRRKADRWVFDPEGPQPKSVALIHCVGSRDSNYNRYCSRVCCMYSLKFAHLIKEKLPGASCHQFYIDMRAFGKGYEEFFERIKDEGVFVVRGRSARVSSNGEGMVVRGEDIRQDKILELPVDMVILAAGLEPSRGTADLAKALSIAPDPDGWFAELNYNADPTGTSRGGIHVAGVCQGPKDIPDTVAQASAVAARVLGSLISGSIQASHRRVPPEEIEQRAAELARSWVGE
jgi:heterodisulfide reductase subunit A